MSLLAPTSSRAIALVAQLLAASSVQLSSTMPRSHYRGGALSRGCFARLGADERSHLAEAGRHPLPLLSRKSRCPAEQLRFGLRRFRSRGCLCRFAFRVSRFACADAPFARAAVAGVWLVLWSRCLTRALVAVCRSRCGRGVSLALRRCLVWLALRSRCVVRAAAAVFSLVLR
jgi:hypothetical protein